MNRWRVRITYDDWWIIRGETMEKIRAAIMEDFERFGAVVRVGFTAVEEDDHDELELGPDGFEELWTRRSQR